MPRDNEFYIEFKDFHHGASPALHLDSLTEVGNGGHYSVATNIDVLIPKLLTQGPGLANLTNGTQAGVVTELINFIMDRPAASNATYGIGPTKLQKISATEVSSGGSPSWPRTVTNMTDGESCIEIGGNLYYFYNKTSGGDIGKYNLDATFDDDWGSTVPTGAAALQKAPHPLAKKEDILLFGNGRYVGTFVNSTTTLAPTKLDFGLNTEVADVLFHANQWWIAVNQGITTGTNRTIASLYLYDGAALSSILFDEVGVGVQQIGFIIVVNGIVYVCWKDLSGTNVIGYVSGRSVKPLAYFSGNLPTHEKKSLYKNFIIFESSGLIYVAGSATPDFPFSISQLADAGYATAGALSAPFGTPMVASTDGGSNQRLAQFSGLDTACTWKSIVTALTNGRMLGFLDDITVMTNHLGSGASCSMTVEANQGQTVSTAMTINTTGRRRHPFTSKDFDAVPIEDFRIALDWSGGSTSNGVKIRKIMCRGHYIET